MLVKVKEIHGFTYLFDEDDNYLAIDKDTNEMVTANWNDVKYMVVKTYNGSEWKKKAVGKPTKKFKVWANEMLNEYEKQNGVSK